MAYRRCGNLYRMMGRYGSAEEMYHEALPLLRRVVAADPRSAEYETQLCGLLCDEAEMVLRRSGPTKAEPRMREAVQSGQRARQKQPDRPATLALARAFGNLGETLRQLGRHDEAVPLARQARDISAIVADGRSGMTAAHLLATYNGVLFAQVLREAERVTEALAAVEEAIQRTTRYLNENPQDTNLRYILAWAHLERSRLPASEREAGEAEAALKNAIADLERLAREFSRTSSFRRKLAEALTDLARRSLAGDDLQVAAHAAQQSISLLTRLDTDEGSPAASERPLAAALYVSAQIEWRLGDRQAAKDALQTARAHIAKAIALSPQNRQMLDERTQMERLAAEIGR
jgi:tetratricopeptide (TPR) repeat protein